jgi:hypothetical protein
MVVDSIVTFGFIGHRLMFFVPEDIEKVANKKPPAD